MKHKHYELIMAWAEGKTIQFKYDYDDDKWHDCHRTPEWIDDREYRVKPEFKPDVVVYTRIIADIENDKFLTWDLELNQSRSDNLQLTFDGQTGKLKAAEMLK